MWSQMKESLTLPDNPFTDQEIIDAPPDVFLAGPEALIPEGILNLVGVQPPVSIHKTCFQQVFKSVNFGLGKTGRFIVVFLRPCQVNGLMGHVQVAGQDNRFLSSPDFSDTTSVHDPRSSGNQAFLNPDRNSGHIH